MTADAAHVSGVPTDADHIREHLQALGLSQREAGRRLGVDNRTMRYYCAGQVPVPPTVMLALEQMREELVPPLVVHPALEATFDAADRNLVPLDELELAGRLHQAIADLGRDLEPPEKRGAFAVVGALNFMSRRTYGTPVWDMHWQPMSSCADDKGHLRHIPGIELAYDETIREWGRRAQAARHPVLRARYADLAWEVAKYRVAAARDNPQAAVPMRPDAVNARLAIDAYLEAVDRKLALDVFAAWRYLGRAVELAATVSDADRLQRAKTAVFECQSACECADPKYPFWLFDDIAWEQRNALALAVEEKAAVIAALERTLALNADRANPQRFDPHIAQDAADRLGRWHRQLGEETEARRGIARRRSRDGDGRRGGLGTHRDRAARAPGGEVSTSRR